MVTRRLRPLRVRGHWLHQIGLPYHWGRSGLVRGDSTNDLIAFVAEPNVSIQESKAFTANIEPGRRSRRRHIPASFDGAEPRRDLPAASNRKAGNHGVVTARRMDGEET
jgi:formate dehydrogenase major subunit